MIRSNYPDPREPVVMDAFTAGWTLAPCSLRDVQGIPHALRAPKARAVTLYELRGGTDAFAAVKLYARYYAEELDCDLPRVPAADAPRDGLYHWLWVMTSRDEGFRALGAAQFRVRTDVIGVDFFVQMELCYLHPCARHRGIFSLSWPRFIRRLQRIHVPEPTMALKISLYGKPTVTLGTDEEHQVRCYTEQPECRFHGGLMQQSSPSLWQCWGKGEDGNVCKESWTARANLRNAKEQ